MGTQYNFEMAFENVAKRFANDLTSYAPFPTVDNRDFWEVLPSSLKDILLSDGNQALAAPYPVLKATDYMAFLREGNRIVFETPYFEKRHLLNKLILAECLENQGKYMDKIIDGIWSICEESTWCLPAHNSYIRDTPQIILADTTRPVMDLFACESGALLAVALYLLRSSLDTVSPLIASRITAELKARIITPYLTQHFWWMGNGDEPMCNWTPWCTQNVLLTTFLLPELSTAAEKLTIFEKASASCDFFLKDYGEDGCCDEGAQYYRHAGLCLFACMEVLNGVSGGAYEELYLQPKIKNIAAYISNVHVEGPYYYNFSDCSPMAGKAGVREYLFGEATKQDFLMDFAAKDVHDALADGSLFDNESLLLNLYFKTQTVAGLSEVTNYYTVRGFDDGAYTFAALAPDIYYESVGIWSVRDDVLALAVKAGDNDDNHNHNDSGSIILYKNGKPILVDIGVETYTQKTFSPQRYEIWTMQSCYHNLPSIDGVDQAAGKEYGVTQLAQSMEGPVKTISMNLSTAYPRADLPAYTRSIRFYSGQGRMTLQDESDAENVVLNFITYEKPILLEGALQVGDARITYQGGKNPTVQVLPITDARLKTAWDHDLYRIQLEKDGVFQMEIR